MTVLSVSVTERGRELAARLPYPHRHGQAAATVRQRWPDVQGFVREVLDHKADALRVCLRKLPEAHRKNIVWRYFEDCGVQEIATKSERTVEAVYRLLSRIREVLNECVSRQLAQPHTS